jgi:cytoskeletal protein CcmA (bactofilin family)
MWKRDTPPSQPASEPAPEPPAPRTATERAVGKSMVNIGKSVIIKGELNGSEDLVVEGQVEGKIDLKDYVLTIGPNGRIRAQIVAKSVVVQGQVVGNITAHDRVTIHESGTVEGDIQTPRFSIAEGARFRGKVDMHDAPAASSKPAKSQYDLKDKSAEAPVPGKPAEA